MKRLAAFSLIALMFTGCIQHAPEGTPVLIYYIKAGYSGGVASAETRYCQTNDIMRFAIDALSQKPDSDGLLSVLPSNTWVDKIEVADGCARIYFSQEIVSLNGFTKTLAEYCVLQTLLQFDGINSMMWHLDDTVICPQVGAEDFYNEGLINASAFQEITLYFTSIENQTLVPKIRKLLLQETESVEWYRNVAEELISGPNDNKLMPVVPPGTRLLSVSLDGKTCVINFSQEYMDSFAGTESDALLNVYAIVNSLTEFPGVDAVLFKVEGGDLTDYFGVDLSTALTRNDTLIYEGDE